MFNSINQILNFRYDPRFLNWNISSAAMSKKEIEDILLLQPDVFTHFKVIIHPQKTYVNPNSVTNDVYCDVKKARRISSETLSYLKKQSDNPNEIQLGNLVCAGNDWPLSRNIEFLKEVRHLFKKIYYEAKNIECDWVTTIPMGTIMGYILRCGGDQILHHINKPKNKTKLIGSAFGSKWPHLTAKISDRRSLADFTQSSAFMDNMFCNPLDYFEKLSDYKFFACPLGNGIQTPKICESIMCETVPVVTNHVAHRELRDIYDLPLLIVDNWSDLTEELLNQSYESKFKQIDWQKEKSKFLVENFKDLIK